MSTRLSEQYSGLDGSHWNQWQMRAQEAPALRKQQQQQDFQHSRRSDWVNTTSDLCKSNAYLRFRTARLSAWTTDPMSELEEKIDSI